MLVSLLLLGMMYALYRFLIRSKKFTGHQIADFAILALRWYLAFYMIDYGWGKMTGGQFQVHDPAILEKPIKEIDEFYIAWHLFSLSKTFNVVVGLSQIIGGVLIVINRTVLIGAFLLLPILFQIFLIDVAFTTNMFGSALPVRLAGMIFSDLVILWYYKEPVIAAWHALTKELPSEFQYNWWVYPTLVIVGFMMDFIIGILLGPVKALIDWIL